MSIDNTRMDIIKLLTIQKDDKQKWIKYYELETYKYYHYIINFLPYNKSILEVGSGGGVFYSKYKDVLIKRNNKYTCIDIDEPSIEYSKEKCDYVSFFVKNFCDVTEREFKHYDVLLLVQSYIQIPNIEKVFKRFFNANPNGYIMMINTIFPHSFCWISTLIKETFLPHQKNIRRTSLSLKKINALKMYLNRKITNIKICNSTLGFDEYLTIIH